VSIPTEKITQPVSILHITDVQVNKVGRYEERVFRIIRELEPDLVLFTGDMLQPQAPATVESELPKLSTLFHSLTPRLGIYGVLGDVDWRIRNTSPEELGNVRMLNNKEALLQDDNTKLSLFGIPCQASRGQINASETIEDWFRKTHPSDFTILLGHGPDYILSVKDMSIDLCLAGHTHGGQVRLPFFGPIITLSEVPRAWARGFRKVGRTRFNVSAGIGSDSPISINNT